MKKLLAVLLALALALALSACGNDKAADTPAETAAAQTNDKAAGSITVCNWYDYIDESVLETFEKETGIHVNYVYATTNEEMYTKLTSGAGSYDVIIPSEYMVERLMKENRLEELDLSNIPNLANLQPRFQDPDYDHGCKYSVPYMWGTLGILYNTTLVNSEITSWTSLFDPQYAGQIIMMNSVRDTLAIGLALDGTSINTRDTEKLAKARDLLIAQKKDNIVGAYMLDETKDKMVAGEAALAVVYSGDAVYAITKNDSLKYVIPSEGSNIWVDAMCIPAGAQNKAGAEAFINFMCRDDIAQLNMDYIGYSSPVTAVAESMDANDPVYYVQNPTEEETNRCEYYFDVSDINDLIEDIWMDIMTA